MLRIFVAITIVILVVLYLAGFNKNERRADFVFVTQGDVFTLDPQRMSWLVDMQAAYCLYEGLVRWNTVDFSIEPFIHQMDQGLGSIVRRYNVSSLLG